MILPDIIRKLKYHLEVLSKIEDGIKRLRETKDIDHFVVKSDYKIYEEYKDVIEHFAKAYYVKVENYEFRREESN